MIRNKYVLSQETICGSTTNFIVHQLQDDGPHEGEQKSALSDINFAPQQNVGMFEQSQASKICCCSCRPIKQLTLQMYGQRLSKASTSNTCCLNLFSSQLIISTYTKVLIGKVKKTCSAFFSNNVLMIENDAGKEVYSIQMKCCQCPNICPRILKGNSELNYQIVDKDGKQVGTITNLFRNCATSLFSLRDDFQLIFTNVQKQKDKILLLNAVVFLNQLRHEWF